MPELLSGHTLGWSFLVGIIWLWHCLRSMLQVIDSTCTQWEFLFNMPETFGGSPSPVPDQGGPN